MNLTFKHRSDYTMIPRYRSTSVLNYSYAVHAYIRINSIILPEDFDSRFSERNEDIGAVQGTEICDIVLTDIDTVIM